MMNKIYICLITIAIALTLACSASATTISLTASLDGFQTVPPTMSPGTGSATMTFDDDSYIFSWDIVWSGLLGTVTAMHFHGPATAGVNAGVQVNFGAISGTSSPSIGSTTITAPQATDLLANLWYINIHTDQFQGGAIRGQVSAVPEPSTIFLFASGMLGLVALRRRMK